MQKNNYSTKNYWHQHMKIFSYLSLCFFALFLSNKTANAQTINRCALPQYVLSNQIDISNHRHERQQVEELIQQHIKKNKSAREGESIIKIPVVVHVIHNNVAGTIGGPRNTNISDEQIKSQIDVLNEDYRKKVDTRGFNTNPVGADFGIEFYLALRDPKGQVTNGITRTYSAQASFDIFNDLKTISNLAYWDSNRYLNIWVTTFKDDYLGYGNFPGAKDIKGLDENDVEEKLDGIFIHQKAFGRQIGTATSSTYGYGRTTTHEVGHWLGLIHTWGDEFCGDDYISDTPPTESENLVFNCNIKTSKCDGRTVTKNMIENYMDYSPDACMNIFTVEQKKRVRAILDLSKRRRRVVISGKNPLPVSEQLTIKVFPNPSNYQANLEILLPDFQDVTLQIYDSGGRLLHEEEIKDIPSSQISLPAEQLTGGVYIVSVSSANQNAKTRWVFQK